MSSGFISASSDATGDEWVKAQQEVEERRREKAKEGQQADGKSLYEVLQANKAAKQEAFEESIRLKHQFRTLDDGEVDFLDSVMEIERAREAALKKETAEGLEAFRKQREKAEEVNVEDDTRSIQIEESWLTNKKRKRDRQSESAPGLKVRRQSSQDQSESSPKTKLPLEETTLPAYDRGESTNIRAKAAPKQSTGTPNAIVKDVTRPSDGAAPDLGLGGYSSDDG